MSWRTSRLVMVKYLNTTSRQAVHTNGLYFKGNRPVINITDLTGSLPVKMGNLLFFSCRDGNISAGQVLEHITSSSKQNQSRQLHQQTSWELCRISWPHFTKPQLVGYEIYDYIRQISLSNASFGIWHLMDLHLAAFKMRLLCFTNELGFSVEIKLGLWFFFSYAAFTKRNES